MLPIGAPGDIDAQQVGYVWVIKDGAQYKMFYSANDAQNFWRVALAVSSDARHWTKVPGKQTGGAILDLGPAGAFDVACAYQPSVVKERDQLYRMWYRGCQAAGPFGGPSLGVIGYAESNDGRTWVKIPQPGASGAAVPVGAAGQFDSGGLTTPAVFLDGATWTCTTPASTSPAGSSPASRGRRVDEGAPRRGAASGGRRARADDARPGAAADRDPFALDRAPAGRAGGLRAGRVQRRGRD